MIPSCLKLEERQIEKFNRFVKFLQFNDKFPSEPEDCSMASPLIFHAFSTGLGDVIYCTGFGFKCDLTIDDDNELFPDNWIN